VSKEMESSKIMVVEDESIVAMEIKSSLTDLGYTVTAIASSGEVALKKVAETQPDLVLMDINLKGDMDGVQTAEKVREHFGIPVIYLTAYADKNTLQRAKLTEPFGYILKPFEEKELNISIEMALYKHQRERQVKASGQWFATTLKSIGDAVIVTDKNNFLVFINTLAEALTGWKREEALGKNLTDIFNILPDSLRNTVSLVTKATQEGVVIDLPEDTTLLAKDGTKIPINGSATTNKDSKGKIIGAILVFRAIDKSKRAPEALPTKVGNSSRTMMDDITLIQTFIQNFIQGQAILLSNPNLRTEPVADTIQLLGKTEGLIVKANLNEKQRSALVKRSSRYWELIHQAMFANSFFPIGQIQGEGVYRYQHRPMPTDYQMHCTNVLELWEVWSSDKDLNQRPGLSMDFIMLKQGTWNPIRDIICSDGKTLHIKTIGDKVTIDTAEMIIWGKKVEVLSTTDALVK
jgi:PAS domain S-box-containing protein